MAVRLRLPPIPTIREIIRIYKLGSRKALSQNFLLDKNITYRIVDSLCPNLLGVHVCEVGPGPGSITRPLLESGIEHLSVIELDKRFIPGLQVSAKMFVQSFNL
jgi:dimethyladenosine transferase 1